MASVAAVTIAGADRMHVARIVIAVSTTARASTNALVVKVVCLPGARTMTVIATIPTFHSVLTASVYNAVMRMTAATRPIVVIALTACAKTKITGAIMSVINVVTAIAY